MESKTVWRIEAEGRVIGTVEAVGDGKYKTKIRGVRTSVPSQVFKDAKVLVDYLDWLAPSGWTTVPLAQWHSEHVTD